VGCKETRQSLAVGGGFSAFSCFSSRLGPVDWAWLLNSPLQQFVDVKAVKSASVHTLGTAYMACCRGAAGQQLTY
jgi:hypothetical protein